MPRIAGRMSGIEFSVQCLQIVGFYLAVIDGLVIGHLWFSKLLAEICKADEAHSEIRFGL